MENVKKTESNKGALALSDRAKRGLALSDRAKRGSKTAGGLVGAVNPPNGVKGRSPGKF